MSYIDNTISRQELVQRTMVDVILRKRSSHPKKFAQDIVWDLFHSASTAQMGQMLAQQRKLNSELAAIACALHDVYVCKTGERKNHAQKGSPIARKILQKTKKFTDREITLIEKAISAHSDKHIVSKNPYVELVKDADLLSWVLYEDVHDVILRKYTDPTPVFSRIKRIRKELHLPNDPQWDRLVLL